MNAKSMLPKLESLQARKKKNWNSDGRSTTLEPWARFSATRKEIDPFKEVYNICWLNMHFFSNFGGGFPFGGQHGEEECIPTLNIENE